MTSQLRDGARNLAGAARQRALSSVMDRMGLMTERLTEYAVKGGPGLLAAVKGPGSAAKQPGKAGKGAAGKNSTGKDSTGKDTAGNDTASDDTGSEDTAGNDTGGDGGPADRPKAQQLKVTNIVEEIDIGAPVSVCYNQWTQFTDFPSFMKKVENVEQESDEKLSWRVNVWWSHRGWQSTILEQVPDERIVWRSEGEKGHVDGGVSFHELAPGLTRVLLVLEYHPKGFVERTANIWRAGGRRARLELKHFARHVMTETVLHPDEVKGWRGEIHDGQVVDGDEPEAGEPEAET